MEPVQKLGLPLFDAICAWCNPHLIPEFRQLTVEEFDQDLTGFLVGHGPERWKVSRYAVLRDQLVEELTDKINAGVLAATGFDSRSPIDAPRVEIPAERWPLLALNLRESSATFDGVKITGIKVRIAEEAEAASPVSPAVFGRPEAPLAHHTGAPRTRLVIKEGSEEVSFDGKRVRLTQRAFKLLLLLAKAVRSGAGSLATATIKDGLVARSASDTAVFDAVRYLRNQLTEQLGPAIDAFELIRNRPGFGYFLVLEPEEIQIQP